VGEAAMSLTFRFRRANSSNHRTEDAVIEGP